MRGAGLIAVVGALVGVALAVALVVPTTALAADVTDMPPELGVHVGLRYTGLGVSGGLVEGGAGGANPVPAEIVSGRRVTRHDLDLAAEFSPILGLAAGLELIYTPAVRFAYPDARTMRVEPLTGAGSYLAGAVAPDTPAVRGSGIEGLWFNVAAAPFSERYAQQQRASWRLEAGFRTPSKHRNLWTAPNGHRGVAPGGTAFRLGGAFSSARGVVEPWVRAMWTHENGVKVDVIDEAGVTWASDLPIKPASTFDMGLGMEVVGYDAGPDAETPLRFAVGPSFTAGYRSWEDVASGVYLPNVLDGARAIPVTSGDTLTLRAALDVSLHAADLIRVSAGLGLDYAVPYRLEHVYDVRTSPGTLGIDGTIAVTGVIAFAKPDAATPAPLE